jgi:hypothetical protein
MQANPDKFQAISIGNKTHKQNIVFDLNGSKINCDDEVKLLGIAIDFKLDFNKLYFFDFLCIFFGTKMPCERTIA